MQRGTKRAHQKCSPPTDPRLRSADPPQPILQHNNKKAPPSLEAVISDYEGDDSGEVQPLPRSQSQSSMTLSEDESDGGGEQHQQPTPVSKKALGAYKPDKVAKAIALLEKARTHELQIRELEFKCGGLSRANACLKLQIETLNSEVEWLAQDVSDRGKRLHNAQSLLKKVLFGEEPICKRRRKVSNECPF